MLFLFQHGEPFSLFSMFRRLRLNHVLIEMHGTIPLEVFIALLVNIVILRVFNVFDKTLCDLCDR